MTIRIPRDVFVGTLAERAIQVAKRYPNLTWCEIARKLRRL